MPLGGCPHDREAEPGTRTLGTPAPETLEGKLGFLRAEAATLVGDAEPDQISGPVEADDDPSTGGSMHPGVLEEVLERALERSRIALHGYRLRRDDVDAVVGVRRRRGQEVEAHDLRRRVRRFFP